MCFFYSERPWHGVSLRRTLTLLNTFKTFQFHSGFIFNLFIQFRRWFLVLREPFGADRQTVDEQTRFIFFWDSDRHGLVFSDPIVPNFFRLFDSSHVMFLAASMAWLNMTCVACVATLICGSSLWLGMWLCETFGCETS